MKGKPHTTVRIWAPDEINGRTFYESEVKQGRLRFSATTTEVHGNMYPQAISLALYQIVAADLVLTDQLDSEFRDRLKEQWSSVFRDLADAIEQGDLDA